MAKSNKSLEQEEVQVEVVEEALVPSQEQTKAIESEVEKEVAKTETFIYIGPTLPGNVLKTNTVLNGTIETIKEFYKEIFEKYPKAVVLVVKTSKLGECKAKIMKSGNVINKYYNEILADINTKKEA